MKIDIVYNQGDSKTREDGFFRADPFFGVIDGVSAPYNLQNPPQLFNGLTGGELVARATEKFFYQQPKSTEPLLKTVLALNRYIKNVQVSNVGDISRASAIGGAAFAAVKINPKTIEIVQACDCFIIWVTKDGKVSATDNQILIHDREMNMKTLRLMKKLAVDEFRQPLEKLNDRQREEVRKKMWDMSLYITRKACDANCNNPDSPKRYALLNGQEKFNNLVYSAILNREKIKYLFLATDGMLPWCLDENKKFTVAEKFFGLYCRKGKNLHKLISEIKDIEREKIATNYINFAEKTAIAIEF